MPRTRSPLPALAALTAALALACRGAGGPSASAAPPPRLSDTGLYADVTSGRIAPDVLAYAPQYPLWSDGAAKRRWIRVPHREAIDAADPDAWRFPAGTMLWKEFSFGGRRVETRFMERRADGRWTYATYLWDDAERDAVLAPERGVPGARPIGSGVRHDVPSVAECRACHQGHATEVLGFSALQLSPDRDPLAPHREAPPPGAVDLPALVARRLLRGLPARLLSEPPRIDAPTPRARAALGYLHANCGGCHTSSGPLASLGLVLDRHVGMDDGAPLSTAADRPSGFRPPGLAPDAPALRVARGAPERSVLLRRMASRDPLVQMPPLGTHLVDEQAAALVAEFIQKDLRP
jgi:hypothetical protein